MPRLVSLRGSIIITSDLTEEMVTKYWFHNFQKKCGKIKYLVPYPPSDSFQAGMCCVHLSCAFQCFCDSRSRWCSVNSPHHQIRISCRGTLSMPATHYRWSKVLTLPGSSREWWPVLGSIIGPWWWVDEALSKENNWDLNSTKLAPKFIVMTLP